MVVSAHVRTDSPSTPTEAVLEVHGLAKSYGRHQVLHDVSFDVPSGALVGISGENGSGKTTLLKCLTGLLRADAGTVTVRGRLGYCPQEPTLLPLLTSAEFLRLAAGGYGIPDDVATERIDRLLDVFGATRFRDSRIDRLSGGTRQKVNLIASVMHEPTLLLLDEPYQGFDYDTYLTFWEYADEFRSHGGAVVIVSHMHTEHHRFDSMLMVRDGSVQAEQVPRAADDPHGPPLGPPHEPRMSGR